MGVLRKINFFFYFFLFFRLCFAPFLPLFFVNNMASPDQSVRDAYEDVRNDNSETTWATFKYDGNTISVDQTGGGNGLQGIQGQFSDDARAYAFVRVTTGDEESKRAKFVFISWCGESVGALKKARMSVEKANVKEVIRDFAIEVHATEADEIVEDVILPRVIKAGGANYSGNTN